jgi:hypothetical protein
MCVCAKVVGCQNTYIYQKKKCIEMKPDGELKDEQLKLFHIRNEIENDYKYVAEEWQEKHT